MTQKIPEKTVRSTTKLSYFGMIDKLNNQLDKLLNKQNPLQSKIKRVRKQKLKKIRMLQQSKMLQQS